jgi:rRNA-processing protein FCF1
MRVLLDTNIVIYRENKRVTNYSVAHLFRWLDKLHYEKIIHPLSKREISKYLVTDPAESMTFKLDAYSELHTVAPLSVEVKTLSDSVDKDENDKIDSALLNEVFLGRVDLLITEDKKLRKKADSLGIANKVISHW